MPSVILFRGESPDYRHPAAKGPFGSNLSYRIRGEAVQNFDKQIVRYRVPPRLPELGEALHPVLHRVYLARGITSIEELERGLDGLPSPTALQGTDEAAALLHRMLEQDRRILVVADFDADGATSCALAVRALRAMGAADVSRDPLTME